VPRADRTVPTRSLLPREHGAYGQLALPMTSALAVSAPSWASLALVAGFIAGFLAHEPLLVALGQRGGRAKREHGPRATRRGITLAALSALGLGLGARLGGPAVQSALLLPGALALALAPFVLSRRERSLPGELLAAAALSAAALPVARAGGAALPVAVVVAAVWAVGYSVATVVIRGVLAASRKDPSARLPLRAMAPVMTLLAGVPMVSLHPLTRAFAVGVAPLCVLSLALALRPPSARSIRAVGWGTIAASVVTLIALIPLLR
jgi:hypothetical protein